MNKKILIIVLVVLPLLIVAVLWFFKAKPSGLKQGGLSINDAQQTRTTGNSSTSSNSSNSQKDVSTSKSGLPVPESHPNVLNVEKNYSATLIRYNFTGIVESLLIKSTATKINLTANDNTLPEFNITKETRFSFQQVSVFEPAVFADLKPGQKIALTVDYEKNGKFWILRDVYINK